MNHIQYKFLLDGYFRKNDFEDFIRERIKTRRINNLYRNIGRSYNIYPAFEWERIYDQYS